LSNSHKKAGVKALLEKELLATAIGKPKGQPRIKKMGNPCQHPLQIPLDMIYLILRQKRQAGAGNNLVGARPLPLPKSKSNLYTTMVSGSHRSH
jgi:hypothetical protein